MSALTEFVRRRPGLTPKELAREYAKQQGIHENAARLEIEGARRNCLVLVQRHASGAEHVYRNFQLRLRRGN